MRRGAPPIKRALPCTELRSGAGFTLIELVLVIGILGFLLFLVLLITTQAIGRDALQSAESVLVQSMRRAQTLAQQNVQGSLWGIYICPGQTVPPECGSIRPSIVLFKRASFVTFAFDATQDQVFEVNPRITFTGTLYDFMTRTSPSPAKPGLVFAQLTGEPTPSTFAGTIILTMDDSAQIVTVSSKGVVEQ